MLSIKIKLQKAKFTLFRLANSFGIEIMSNKKVSLDSQFLREKRIEER